MKKHITALLFCLVTSFIIGQEQPSKFIILDNISLNNKIYSIKVKNDQFGFVLEICTTITNCKKTLSFSKTVAPSTLSRGIINFVNDEFDQTLVASLPLDTSEQKILDELTVKREKQEFQINEAAKTDLERTLGEIDRGKNQYSGKLIIHKTAKYWLTDSKEAAKFVNDKKFFAKNKKSTGTLEIIDSKVKFFNNKASSIYIKAKLTEAGQAPETLIFLNNNFSVAVRYFNYYGNRVSAQKNNKQWVTIDFNDVFNYESDQYYNYSVANGQISLSTVSLDSMSVKIKQRRFFDYFTGIVYSDVLSFNTENSNSLLNAQAKLLIPLNLRNAGQLSFMRQFTTSVNVALSNSFSDETRFIAIKDNETFNHFDLLKKHNLSGKLDFQVINLEYKRLFMNISLGYSAAFYRAGFQYTQTGVDAADVVTNRQLLSLGHGPFLNFEIRPQSNFGADIVVSFEDLNYNETASINGRNFKNDIIDDRGQNHFGVKYNLVNVEANFYWLTSDDKTGGVYAKIGSYYHTQSYEIFPQIMVGYATNLTSFVNRFKPKNKSNTN